MACTRFPSAILLLLALLSFSSAHTVITYPGWRGDTLYSNGTTAETNGLMDFPNPNGTRSYPYGMQWEYPCGGIGTTTNRTKWPVSGGAVGFQPGWFQGHSQGMFYINLGEGTQPLNMSNVMVGPIGFLGPTNDPYPQSSICMLQVPLPTGFTPNIGDNATIQVVLLAQHGAALYSCVDITFADPKDVAEVNRSNCQNTTDISFTTLFTAQSCSAQASAAAPSVPLTARFAWAPILVTFAWALLS